MIMMMIMHGSQVLKCLSHREWVDVKVVVDRMKSIFGHKYNCLSD